MKNTIYVNCARYFSTRISYEKDQSKAIFFVFEEPDAGAVMEIMYGAGYQDSVAITAGELIQLPERYCSDNEIVRVRYVDNLRKSRYIVIHGDESASKDLQLRRRNNYLFTCTGTGSSAGPVTPPSEDEQYMKLLAALISDTTQPTPKDCYEDLKDLRTAYILELLRLGVVGKDKTMKEILQLLKQVQRSNPFDVMQCKIAAFTFDTKVNEVKKVTLREV